MDAIRYSIIIPVFNHSQYVSESIESALKQKNAEVIVINDGSTDNSLDIIKKYDVVVIDKPNTGVADSRNVGIEKAKGEYIICLDADDILADDFTEVIDNFNQDLLVIGFEHFGEDTNSFIPVYVSGKTQNILNQICITCPFKKDLWSKVQGFDTTLDGYEDWDFFNRIINAGATIETIPIQLLKYRICANSRNKDAIKRHEQLKSKITKC
jgi:glycosyltransferase involved in cell wall biosynthesis